MKKIDVVNLAQELGRDLANAEESVEDAADTMRCAAERLSDERWRADRQLQNLLATDEPDNSGEWVQL